jgi:hypothetical protein
MDLKEVNQINDGFNHWYYRSKYFALTCLIGDINAQNVLDVGAGSGIFCKMLLQEDYCKSAYCLDTGYEKEREEVINGKILRFIKEINIIKQDLILFMDVLEHVSDDVGFLIDYTNKMQTGSHVIISVPAFQFIWSHHDEFLDHKRRYSLKQLKEVVHQSGLHIIETRYFFATLFPIVTVFRLLGTLKKSGNPPRSDLNYCHPIINRLLFDIHVFECNTFFKFNRLFGLTLFCLAKVPGQTKKK